MNVLSILTSHDASVAYISNGELKYFAKEERLSGYKHDKGCTKGLDYIIKNNFLVDLIVLNSTTVDNPYHEQFLEPHLRKQFGCEVIHLNWEHHLSHACFAFHNSSFDEALVFVADRHGSTSHLVSEVETIFKFDSEYNIKQLYKNFALSKNGDPELDVEVMDFIRKYKVSNQSCEIKANTPYGITHVYESATTLINEGVLNGGKAMGLSSYGNDQPYVDLFHNGLADDKLFMKCPSSEGWRVLLKDHYNSVADKVTEVNYQFYADYCYQVQKQTQQQSLRLIKKYVEKTGIKKVCVSGGYGLNVVTNQYLIKNLPDVEFYFEPIADDSSISLGAAIYAHKNELGTVPTMPKNTFFNHIHHDVRGYGNKKVSERDIAKFIAEGKIVAVFNGQAETGPRALGNRSILFDATNPDAKRIVNTVKRREWYRPFACSVLKEDAKEYFEMYHLDESPNMTISFPVKNKSIPGVTHVDNTCRIQTVDSSIPHFYRVLKEYKKITGVSVVLNTSFNLAGEPLVESPADAVDVFNRSDIDVLWFPESGKAIIPEGI